LALLIDGVKDRLRLDLRVHLAAAEAEFWASPDFSRVAMPPGYPDALRRTAKRFLTDLKHRLAAILASPRGKALIDAGQKFSMEELQAACAEVLAEAESSDEKTVIEAALKALIARKAN
jgi:hypothetical protein